VATFGRARIRLSCAPAQAGTRPRPQVNCRPLARCSACQHPLGRVQHDLATGGERTPSWPTASPPLPEQSTRPPPLAWVPGKPWLQHNPCLQNETPARRGKDRLEIDLQDQWMLPIQVRRNCIVAVRVGQIAAPRWVRLSRPRRSFGHPQYPCMLLKTRPSVRRLSSARGEPTPRHPAKSDSA